MFAEDFAVLATVDSYTELVDVFVTVVGYIKTYV